MNTAITSEIPLPERLIVTDEPSEQYVIFRWRLPGNGRDLLSCEVVMQLTSLDAAEVGLVVSATASSDAAAVEARMVRRWSFMVTTVEAPQ